MRPLTPETWGDLERLFGQRGACGGCWCMWWRLPRSQFTRQKGAANKDALKRIVDSGQIAGLLGYEGGSPIAWISVAPREVFPVLERSRTLKRIDQSPVWSIVCLFVAKPWRGKDVASRMIAAARDYARGQGASIVEGYPVEPRTGRLPDAFAWTGLPSSFRKTGFVEALRRSDTRPIMRCYLEV